MLFKVEARTKHGTLLTLELDDVSDGLILAEVGGLDPVEATLVSSSFAQQDGQQFQAARRELRQITMKIELDPADFGTTVTHLRRNLYRFFMPKSEVSLRFFDSDGLEVDIVGRVKDFKSELFSERGVVDITFHCFDPDLVDPTTVIFESVSTDTTDRDEIFYVGDVEAGFVFVLNVDRELTEFTIYHTPPDNIIRTLDFAAILEDGDVVTISTVPGDKYVTLNRGGTLSSLLYAKSPQSPWLALDPGQNYIRVYAEGAPIPYSITYNARFGGL